jgi:hypothetical protein
MRLIILGTDHIRQRADDGLRQRIEALIKAEHVTLIGEEYLPTGIGGQVAASKGVPWIEIDMSCKERNDAGIGSLACRRAQYRANNFLNEEIAIYAPYADGVRETSWLTKMENTNTGGPALLICGAIHLRPLTEKAEQRGHQVLGLFYPEDLSELQVHMLPEPE